MNDDNASVGLGVYRSASDILLEGSTLTGPVRLIEISENTTAADEINRIFTNDAVNTQYNELRNNWTDFAERTRSYEVARMTESEISNHYVTETDFNILEADLIRAKEEVKTTKEEIQTLKKELEEMKENIKLLMEV
jgi:hypothetical protein